MTSNALSRPVGPLQGALPVASGNRSAGSLLPQDLQGLYEYATREIEEARMAPGLWAEAGEQSRGVGAQRREIYLAARVNELRGIAEEQLRKERQCARVPQENYHNF